MAVHAGNARNRLCRAENAALLSAACLLCCADIDSYLAQPDQQPPPPAKSSKPRGRQAAALKQKAAEDAAAAAESAAAAEAAAAQQAAHDADAAAAEAAQSAALSPDSSTDDDEDQEDDEGVEYGIIDDPAPYVILRLADTEETRALWPHKFELYYKVGTGAQHSAGKVAPCLSCCFCNSNKPLAERDSRPVGHALACVPLSVKHHCSITAPHRCPCRCVFTDHPHED